ncbi:hypothetical protein JRC04_23470 [Mycolicibacterium sp. S2-37]|uniref:hypothetical protein n=1 Tax=Mycolicibacterium sp. S2-37 TaxID=2810297 RepID=UPI001A949D09|nr:hypothetical protein [Mycolicibacterium sp. S2-37]MBO0680437.1 hypothetical protein [Mycolicibacterium sp. S2-37]
MTAGLMSVVLALGSVFVNIAGGEVLKATHVSGLSADGTRVSTAVGDYLYITMASVLSASAAVPAIMLLRSTFRQEAAAPAASY